MKKSNVKKGFTLVELLVVISIIALLLAVLIPSLSKAKEVANRIICGNHQKDFGMANNAYANMCNGAFVPIAAMEPNTKGTININGVMHESRAWISYKAYRDILKYDSYPKDKKNAPMRGQERWNAYNTVYNQPLKLLCPTDKICVDWKNELEGVLFDLAYNMTDWGIPGEWDLAFKYNTYMGHKADTIRQPASKLAFIDGIDWWTNWGFKSADFVNWNKLKQASSGAYRNKTDNTNVYAYGPVMYRHSEGAVCGFYDGHVKYMKKADIYVYADIYQPGSSTLLPPLERKPGMWVSDWATYVRNQSGY